MYVAAESEILSFSGVILEHSETDIIHQLIKLFKGLANPALHFLLHTKAFEDVQVSFNPCQIDLRIQNSFIFILVKPIRAFHTWFIKLTVVLR